MIKNDKVTVNYKNQNIKLAIQYDIDVELYPEKQKDISLQGILVMQIWGKKDIIEPILKNDMSGLSEALKNVLLVITKKKIIHIPKEAWPQKSSDWPIDKGDDFVI